MCACVPFMRKVGDSVESSRPVDFSTVANSGSITSSRLSAVPGSGPGVADGPDQSLAVI